MPWLDAAWQAPRWFDEGALPFDIADRGLLLGDGVFDTSLVLAGRMVWRDAHVGRLLAACAQLGFPLDPARIGIAIDETLGRMGDGSLRLTVTRGPGPRGLAPAPGSRPTILATTAPMRAATLFASLRLSVSAIRRNETSPLSRLKSLNYGDGVLAATEARTAGYDDALFFNTRGQVVCTASANLFALIGSRLVTPPLGDGILAGVVREILLHSVDRIGLSAQESSLSLTDLAKADAVFSTNSLRLLAPVEAIAGMSLSRDPNRTNSMQPLVRLVGTGLDRTVHALEDKVAQALARGSALQSHDIRRPHRRAPRQSARAYPVRRTRRTWQ